MYMYACVNHMVLAIVSAIDAADSVCVNVSIRVAVTSSTSTSESSSSDPDGPCTSPFLDVNSNNLLKRLHLKIGLCTF